MVGSLIKEARKSKKITQVVLAKHSGITQTYLSQIETDTKTPTIEVLNTLATTMGFELQIRLIEKT